MNSTKGIETLLGAADELVRSELDFRLLFVGEDRGESDPTNADIAAGARRLSSQSGLEQRVIRTGWLPPAEISRALWAADVAALPYTDGASLRRSTLITCFAHGVPVVTTSPIAQPAVPEQCLVEPFDEPEQYVIDDTVAALIPAGDHMALAGQLRRLAADAARRKALGRAGRKLAQGLSWPTIAAATARFYDRVVGNAA